MATEKNGGSFFKMVMEGFRVIAIMKEGKGIEEKEAKTRGCHRLASAGNRSKTEI